MHDIRTLLKIAARRLEISRFLRHLHAVVLVAASIGLTLIIIDRLPATAFIPWMWVMPLFGVVALVVTVALWARRRGTELHVAVVVDERLDLSEKLSTALHCSGRDDAFAQAALEDAVRTARDGRTRERVRRHFRVDAPRGWWLSPLVVFLAIMTSFLGQLDVFSTDVEEDPDVIEARNRADDTVEAVIKAIEDKPELSEELSDLLGQLSEQGTDFDRAERAEDVKRDAIKKVTDINRALEELMNGEKGKTADAIERALSQLKTPEDGPASDLAEDLASGNFKGAQEALQQMLEDLQKGNLDEEQQKALADQLQNMADQLQQLAEQQEQLEKALEQAGLDPALAQNAQALQQALQNNPNLNQQQIQQLQQMAQAQQAAQQACQGLGQACQQMAQGLKAGEMGQLGQAGQAMGDQLDGLEQMQMMLQQAQAAANACQGQCQGLGQGLGMQQAMQQWSKGMGQRGQGAGGKAPIAPTPTGTTLVKADTKLDPEGDIVARTLFDGPQVRGESQAKMRQVAETVRQGYDEAINDDELPRRYHEPHLHYFGELKKLTEVVVENGGDGEEAGADADAVETADTPTESGE